MTRAHNLTLARLAPLGALRRAVRRRQARTFTTTTASTPEVAISINPEPVTMSNSKPHTVTRAQRYFAPLKLADVSHLDVEAIEVHCLALGDANLRGIAIRITQQIKRLVDQAGMASLISAAVEAARVSGGDPQEHLEGMLRAVTDELAATKSEHTNAEQRRKARMTRLQPLLNAVSMRLTSHERELEVLSNRLSLAKQQVAEGFNQFQRLLDAGLSREQIAKLGDIENPVDVRAREIARMEARIAELRGEIPKLKAFSDDPRHDPAHLNGLDGFDQLILAALPAPEVLA